MTASKKPKLTVKQAKFVKAKAEGKTNIEAAMLAYDTTSRQTADVIAKENLRKTSIQEALHIALEKHGLTPDRIVGVVDKAMNATKIVTSPTEPDKIVDDHSIRLKAAGMAAQFMGINKLQDGSTNNFIQINNDYGDKYAD